jgi:hypothetical protein
MNPTQEQLNTLRDAFYSGDAFLDIAPVDTEDGDYTVSLHDDFGNEVTDSLTFSDEATARRFIDWLIDNAHTIQVIQSREFVL